MLYGPDGGRVVTSRKSCDMTREETKREIQRLWINWPDRKCSKECTGLAALTFYGSLQNENESILQDVDFGSGEQYLTI